MWQPSASIETLKLRANVLKQIRQFFHERDVLEVDTPLLSHNTVTDVHLDAFESKYCFDESGSAVSMYLQTSPEFAMKRLLCAGSGSIFQICKAFRNESAGRNHNPEFTMLEWYRVGFNDHDLMDEVETLLQTVLGCELAKRISYQEIFQRTFNFDPLSASIEQLKHTILQHSPADDWVTDEQNKDTLLQWLFSIIIEPSLQTGPPCFVFDFPASQAALAQVNEHNPAVAHRFELYYQGLELANGYFELQDGTEQLKRFEQDNQVRASLNKPKRTIDKNLVNALEQGLPSCAGVALGLDRLLMCKTGASHIKNVISFDHARS